MKRIAEFLIFVVLHTVVYRDGGDMSQNRCWTVVREVDKFGDVSQENHFVDAESHAFRLDIEVAVLIPIGSASNSYGPKSVPSTTMLSMFMRAPATYCSIANIR